MKQSEGVGRRGAGTPGPQTTHGSGVLGDTDMLSLEWGLSQGWREGWGRQYWGIQHHRTLSEKETPAVFTKLLL